MSVLDKPCWVRKGGVLAYWSRCYGGEKVGEVIQLLDPDTETHRATMEPEFNRFAGAGPPTVDFDTEKDAQDYVERGLRLHLQAEQRRERERAKEAVQVMEGGGARTRQWEHHGDDLLITMDGAVEGGRVERRGAIWDGIVYDPAGERIEAPFATQDEAQKHVTRVLATRDWTAWRAERQRINEASAAKKAEATATLTQISDGPPPVAGASVGATAKVDYGPPVVKAQYTPPAYATAPPVKAPPWPGDEKMAYRPYWGALENGYYPYLQPVGDPKQPDNLLGKVEIGVAGERLRYHAIVGGLVVRRSTLADAKAEVVRMVEVVREAEETDGGETIDEFAMELRRHADEAEAEARAARLALAEVLSVGPEMALDRLRSRSDDCAEESRRLSDAAVLVAEGIARRKLATGDVVEGNENASATHPAREEA